MRTKISEFYLGNPGNSLSVEVVKEDEGTYVHIQVHDNKEDFYLGVELGEKGISELIEDLRFEEEIHFICEQTQEEILTIEEGLAPGEVIINIRSLDDKLGDNKEKTVPLSSEEYSNFYNFLLLAKETF